MTDVFISYERGSEAKARQIAHLLRVGGFDVWLDDDLPTHRAYSDVIREQLEAAKAVLVLWTAEAAQSEWVRAEADLAREQRKLTQASLDGVIPPLPFNQIHTGDLSHWRGDARDAHWLKIVESVTALVGAPRAAATTTASLHKAFAPRSGASRWIWAAAIAAVLLAAAGGLWTVLRHPHAGASAPTAVAVLPFQTESVSPAVRFFADGVADTIQSALSNDQIRVIPRREAGALAGPGAEAAIARLGVRLILNGSAAADAKTFDVSVHVDDALNHLTLWSGHFTGSAEHPDELNTSVAASTVAVLHCSADALAPHGLTDPQVLMLYLQACDLYERATADPQAYDQLLDKLRQVTQSAPKFAPALAMRAEELASESTDALRAEGRDDANRALAIDPKNARARAALSFLLPVTDWENRESTLRRALKADPDSEWANGYLGEMLAEVGRVQEAADLLRKANAANPLALDWSAESARMAALAGRAQEATDEAAAVAKAWPNDASARLSRLEVASIQSDWNQAFELLDGGRVQMSAALISATRKCLQAFKSPAPALRAKARDAALGAAGEPGGVQLALTCLAKIGYVDDALAAARSYSPASLGSEPGTLFRPELAAMRRDPRFMQLAHRLGLTRYWRTTGSWPDFCAEPGLPYDCKAEAARLGA